VIFEHIMGLPIEESLLPLAPAGAAVVTAVTVVGRARLRSLRERLDRGLRGGEE
jgi:hypothetical protein